MTSTRPSRAPRTRRFLAALTATVALAAAVFGAGAAVAADRESATSPPDEPSISFTAAPADGGVLAAGQPLTVSLSARNSTSLSVATGTVHLSTSARPLATRSDLRAWLEGEGPADRTDVALADTAMPGMAAGSTSVLTATVDGALFAGYAPGVYPLRASYDSDGGGGIATSVVVIPGDPGTGALGVVVPITAPAIGTGLLDSEELTELTAARGALRVELDAVTGTSAILAVDPAIVAAIRVLGTKAPATATQWLDDLMGLPNPRFALQFADADLATQVAAGLKAPLAPTTLDSYMTASSFPAASSPTPQPSGSPDGSPGSNGSTGGIPTLADLMDVGAGPGVVFWPATGTAGAEVVAADAAQSTPTSPAITLIDSGALTTDDTVARAQAGDAQLLVYDADASTALGSAASATSSIDRQGALAAASAYAALAVAKAPGAPLLVAVDRSFERTDLRGAVVAAQQLGGRTATGLAQIAATPPASVGLRAVAGDDSRADALGHLISDETALADFSSILTTPEVLTSPERASMLQVLGNAWRLTPDRGASALADHRAQTKKTLASVSITPSSSITLAATSAPLGFAVRNDLPWPVSLVLIATPGDARLVVQNTTPVEAGPEQTTRAKVPVQARVGSGESTLHLKLRSPTMVAIGDQVSFAVSVRAEWESVGLIVMAAIVGLMLVLGVVRTVTRRRRRRALAQRSEEDPEVDPAEDASAADRSDDVTGPAGAPVDRADPSDSERGGDA